MSSALVRILPIVSVILWSSGFITARLVGPYIEPMTFVALRNSGVTLLLLCLVVMLARTLPTKRRDVLHLLFIGALNQGLYLIAVYAAVRNGLPAGIAALIGGLQPILTTIAAIVLLDERVPLVRWGGIAIAFAGVALVLAPRIEAADHGVPFAAAILCLAGVGMVALATAWQRRFVPHVDLLGGASVQFSGAASIALLGSFLFETRHVIWSYELIIGLVWAVVGLGAIGMLLFLYLMSKGALSVATSLLFLVPATASLMAYFLFHEELLLIQIFGMTLSAVGVAITTRHSGTLVVRPSRSS